MFSSFARPPIDHRRNTREMSSKTRPPKTTKPRRTAEFQKSAAIDPPRKNKQKEGVAILSQMGEMGDLETTLTRFLIWSSDLPRRASWSLTNLRFARRCCGVCACGRVVLVVARGVVGQNWCVYHCVVGVVGCGELRGGRRVDQGILAMSRFASSGWGTGFGRARIV